MYGQPLTRISDDLGEPYALEAGGGGWVHIIYKTSKLFNVCEKVKLQNLLLRKKKSDCV